MKIDKVIFGVDDNPLYADFWPIQAKLVKEILKAEPVLFHITTEDSDFYFDGNGTVKKINKDNCFDIITSFQSQIVRMYGTKYFPDEICLTADIDMLMLNPDYFIDQIKDVPDEDLIIFDSMGYDPDRIECQDPSLHCHERYPICYNAGKGKTFDKILKTDREFSDYVDELQKLRLGWGTDEIYFARCVNDKKHGVNITKLKRDKISPWITDRRIERHNFPTTFTYPEEERLNSIHGVYDPIKLSECYYIDAHCPRPYSEHKDVIDSLVYNLKKNNMLNIGRKIKKVALISTFCDTQEKLNILEENIFRIKKLGIDVIAISPIEIPYRIVKLCDYFFYTKDNELLKWPVRMYTHWYQMPISEGRITTLHRGLADYGWAGLHQVKKLSQIALTFDYDVFYHIIYDLEFDETVEQEFKSDNVNIIHPRRDPNNPDTLWETTLHLMVFDREMMTKIEKEITLEEYLRTNGVAEGEVLKWKNKYNIQSSNHPVKDKIFYWGNYDFFDYSPFSDFKMFLSKNEEMSIWLGENPCYESDLTSNLRIVFHGFEEIDEIKITVNGSLFSFLPKKWEIIEIPISSSSIEEILFEYNSHLVDFSEEYKKIMLNQIYYNHRP